MLGPCDQLDLVSEIKAGTLALEPFEPTLVQPSCVAAENRADLVVPRGATHPDGSLLFARTPGGPSLRTAFGR